LDQEEGFLARVAGPFFFGVTAGFFSLTIVTVDWGDAAVVSVFHAVVEGGAFDMTVRYTGVVRGTRCVRGLYGLMRAVVWGLEDG